MRTQRAVSVVAAASTPFTGKFHPDHIWRGHPQFGKRQNPSLEELLGRAVREAIADSSLEASSIERSYVGNFAGELFASQGHLGALLSSVCPALDGKPAWRVEGACASGGLALIAGIEAVGAGVADCVLVAGVEVQTTASARQGADWLARAAHYETERDIDPFTFPCLFARRTKHCLETTPTTAEDLASIVVAAHSKARSNPLAHYRSMPDELSLEDALRASDRNPLFLENPEFHETLRVFDCAPVSDGAAALLLVASEAIDTLGLSAERTIEVVSYGVASANLRDGERDLAEMTTTASAARAARQSSPERVQRWTAVEVHDCFHIAAALQVEALGLALPGHGARLVGGDADALVEGIDLDPGSINAGGGLLAGGHPVGATGVKQAVAIRERLLSSPADTAGTSFGLSSNMGGDDRSSVVILWRHGGRC